MSVALNTLSVWLLMPFVSSILSNSLPSGWSTVGKLRHLDLISVTIG